VTTKGSKPEGLKVFAISDLHLSFQTDKPMDIFGENWVDYERRIMEDWNAKVCDGDVGIIAGDISWAMRTAETVKDFEYLGKLKGTKIIVRGNHDYWWSTITKVRESLPTGIHALQNDSVKIGNVVFAGTRGWRVPERYQKQTDEDKKILNREIMRFEMSLKDATAKRVKGDKLIAIIHYPPFNSMRDDSAFTELCEKYDVSSCVYGHLHGKPGRADVLTEKKGIKYYLTSCDQVEFGVVEIL
jgi:hypothetical protein